MSEKDEQVINITKIEDDTQYWFFRAGRQARYLEEFYFGNYIGIADNDIKLSDLLDIRKDILNETDETKFSNESSYKSFVKSQLENKYKTYIYNQLLENKKKEFKARNPDSDVDPIITNSEKASLNRSSSIQASQNLDFVENMKPGDIVLIPKKRTNGFYIGYIDGDVYSEEFESTGDPKVDKLQSKYEKKRKIKWIKKISIEDLPDKLYWIKNSHKTIFNISQDAESVNSILSNLYLYKGNLHSILNVKTTNGINSDDWLDFQNAIKIITKENNNQIFQKQKVQSPGNIELYVGMATFAAPILMSISIVLFSNKYKYKGKHIEGEMPGIKNILVRNLTKYGREMKEKDKIIEKYNKDAEENEAKMRAQVAADQNKIYNEISKAINENISNIDEDGKNKIESIKQVMDLSNESKGKLLENKNDEKNN